MNAKTRHNAIRLPLIVASSLLLSTASLAQTPWTTTRTSIGTGGLQGNFSASSSSTSADGRYVAFASAADNLVAGDGNGASDVFLLDRVTGTVSLVDVALGGGVPAMGASEPEISEDGNWIGFLSTSADLVSGDTNGRFDVFLANRTTGAIQRVSVSAAGGEGDGDSLFFALDADASTIAFLSYATNLVPGDVNGMPDILVHDLTAGTVSIASVSSGGTQGNFLCGKVAISADGLRVAFESSSDNLVAGDTNGVQDIFLRDRTGGTTTRVSVGAGGVQGNGESSEPALSGDGKVVAFVTNSTNLDPVDTNFWKDVYVRDLTTLVTSVVSVNTAGTIGNGQCGTPDLTQDGSGVVFWSTATNLFPGPSNSIQDVFYRDRTYGQTLAVSRDSRGVAGAHHSSEPRVSPDGRWIAFTSKASNLVPGDTNFADDTFLYERTFLLTPMHRGTPLTMTATSLAPGERAFFVYSLTGIGAGPCYPTLGFLCMDLLSPIRLLASATADPTGVASFTFTIPPHAPLIPISMQAVVPRGVGGADTVLSNPVLETILP